MGKMIFIEMDIIYLKDQLQNGGVSLYPKVFGNPAVITF